MRKMLMAAAILVSTALPATLARADCAYDMKQISARLDHEPDRAKAAAVRKLLVRAETERRTQETECRNDVTRAWAMLHAPPDVAPPASWFLPSADPPPSPWPCQSAT